MSSWKRAWAGHHRAYMKAWTKLPKKRRLHLLKYHTACKTVVMRSHSKLTKFAKSNIWKKTR